MLIVDDSPLMRDVLRSIVDAHPQLEVVAAVENAYQARDAIKRLHPDVITLDVEMPGMDGLSFLRNLMRLRPMPVVMVSSFTTKGASISLEALELGAVDVVQKPSGDRGSLAECARDIRTKLLHASKAKAGVIDVDARRPPPPTNKLVHAPVSAIVIGASTGGTEALRRVLSGLAGTSPPVLIAQHIPPAFSESFAARLNAVSGMSVKQAEDGDMLRAGHAFVAPGDKHLTVHASVEGIVCALDAGRKVNRHRPSVDVLFASAARTLGARAIGVLLTGMGNDGAQGLSKLRATGAITLAQDEETSVVWGMPGAAYRRGAVQCLLPLPEIATHLSDL